MGERKRKRVNLYLPEVDGEEIMKAVRHAAVDHGIRMNDMIFRLLRQGLGLPEPGKKKRAKLARET